jgi:uncharacterized protein YggE
LTQRHQFDVLENMRERTANWASDGVFHEIVDVRTPARLATTFKGEAGIHNISIDYFDENDGVSRTALIVDGVEIGQWVWDQNLGSPFANASTRTTMTFEGVVLREGSVIEIIGWADAAEPLRIDALRTDRTGDLPPPPPPVVEAPAELTYRVEAEDLKLTGYAAQANGSASGGRHITLNGTGAAEYVHAAADGVFDITFAYYDENDGVSTARILLNGQQIDAWAFDKMLASPFANASTLAQRVITGVELRAGDVITIVGTSNADEPARFDYIDFNRTGAIAPPPPPVVEAPVQPEPPVVEPPVVEAPAELTYRVEAEDLKLTGYAAQANGSASGGRHITLNGTGAAEYVHAAADGVFDITFAYYDENDGVSTARILLNGQQIDAWAFDKMLASPFANASTLAQRVITGVELRAGDVITIVGTSNADEPARFDYIDFNRTGAIAPPPPPVVEAPVQPEPPVVEPPVVEAPAELTYRVEAEDLKLTGYAAQANGSASGGRHITLNGTGAAEYVHAAADGVFDITFAYYDENDGVSTARILLNGQQIDAWAFDKMLASPFANASTLAQRVITGVELRAGDVITIVGTSNADEPARFDYIDFNRTGAIAPPPPPVEIVIQAEGMELVSNFRLRALDVASDGVVIEAPSTTQASVARAAFDGKAGVYTLTLDYFDENDGKSQMSVFVDGVQVDSWVWNQDLGSMYADAKTATSYTISGVTLNEGSVIELRGRSDAAEPLRVDAIRLLRSGDAPERPSDGGSSGSTTPDPVKPGPVQPDPVKPGPIENVYNPNGPKVGAFDGVEGFGADAIGGRGGQVVTVTNLKDSGVGSLRWALEDVKGPRIVVFNVEGEIQLTKMIKIRDPYVTLAGQSAPGEGVVVTGGRLSVETHEVIIRGMKMRPGDGPVGDKFSDRDGIALGGNGDLGVKNVVIDSNSMTWAPDENFSIWGSVRDVTISNNLIAEGLRDHSMGGIVGRSSGTPNSENVSILKNLWISNEYRNAALKQVEGVEFANNLILNYGAGHQGLHLGGGPGIMTAHVINNAYYDGPSTNSGGGRPAFDLRPLIEGSKVYLEGNYIEGHLSPTQNQLNGAHGATHMVVKNKIFEGSDFEVLATKDVFDFVSQNAGARTVINGLDVVDRRIVADAIAGKAKIIDSQNDVGGMSGYKFTNAVHKDSDGDGMPDWFETLFADYGFDVNQADDKLDYTGDGYTNIEAYLNGLIDGFDTYFS